MNRRAFSIAAATAALLLVPASAMAYTGNDYQVVDAPPAVVSEGTPFDITVTGPAANPSITLTITAPAAVPDSAIRIAGTQSATKATTNGAATFTVTLTEEANYNITAVDAAGTVILETSVVVGDAVPTADGALPDTGSSNLPLIAGAGALLAVGAGVVVYARRQQQNA